MTWRGLPWWRIALRTVGVAVTLLLVAAFGFVIYLSESLSPNYEDTMISAERLAELEAEMASKESAEDVTARYEEMLQTLADDMSGLLPGLTWQWQGESGFGQCAGEYQSTRGISISTRRLVASAPIPESMWPKALAAMRATADELGATDVQVYADEPGRHSLAFYGNGKTVRVVAGQRIVLSARSDCHLREADLPGNAVPR